MEKRSAASLFPQKEPSMTPLRQRMTEDMQLRNLSTQWRGSSGAAMFEFLEFFARGGMTARGSAPPGDAGLPNDFDPKEAASYAPNWGGEHFRACDLAKVWAADLPGHADLAWASFPCQDPCRRRRRAQGTTVPGRSGPSGTDESIELR
jgi:hypothetical protein